MNKTILIRTIKTALAAIAAIIVAEQLELDYAAAAGIIAILNIFETRKATFQGGLKRALSAVLALAIGGACFEFFGYNTWIFGLYLLFFVPVSFLLNVEVGLGPSSVLVTHLLAFGTVDKGIILNELALVFLGTGFALVTNFYAPNRGDKLEELTRSIDEKIQFLLTLFGKALVKSLDVREYESELIELEEAIDEAVEMATVESDNMVLESNRTLYNLQLRKRECLLLKDIYYDLKSIPPDFTGGHQVSELLIDTANAFLRRGAIKEVEAKIYDLKSHYDEMALPENHEEFKIRATVLQIFRTVQQFIDISDYISNSLSREGHLIR